MTNKTVSVPDIGTDAAVDVIELLVKVGDTVSVNDSLATLEGDKATMEVPSPVAGVISALHINVGDKVKKGDPLLDCDVASAENEEATESAPVLEQSSTPSSEQLPQAMLIPDLGNAGQVEVIEILIKPGDSISSGDSILTLESDKASMEVPASFAGTVVSVEVAVGNKVSQGTVVAMVLPAASAPVVSVPVASPTPPPAPVSATPALPKKAEPRQSAAPINDASVHAGPAVRRLANELGVDLRRVVGTGHKNRISLLDVRQHVKKQLEQAYQGGGAGIAIAPMPEIDFSQFGEIEHKPLSKIKRLTGQYTHRSWVTIPHVTQFDEADITELEAFRQSQKEESEKQGVKLTPLVFIMKAVVSALKAFPQFNSSLSPNGEELIYKKYFHLGVAVETPNGLLVPVIRDVDQKGIQVLAQELAVISKQAREKGLQPAQMQGSSFTISSLGGIGGTAFTPIVNQPDVAILGVSKSSLRPVYQDNTWVPRLMLPLSLSYDHRVIDGAEAARFTRHLAGCLEDLRRILL